MERLSRYILVLIAIITCAVMLPQLYWMAFDKPINIPYVMYSCTDDDFLIRQTQNEKVEWIDTHGNSYTREEYEQKLPMMYTRQLLVSGTMPDTIKGLAMDMHVLNKAKSIFNFKPDAMNGPQPRLFPLFESESGRANLEMPDDYFRITWRIEFINASTNKIDEQKSNLFSGALSKKGFTFPAKSISGLPTTRKSCDEGYLIIDAADQLFHLKMMEGHPFVRKVELPANLKFKFISCVDFKDKKYYAYLFSDQNEIYILTQDLYELVKLPVEGFNADNCELRILGDIFHYNVSIQAENKLKVFALNYADFQKVDTYEKSWMKRSERPKGKIAATLFPFQLKLSNKYSSFTNFYFEFSSGFFWVIVNLLFVAAHLLFLLKRNAKIGKNLIDLSVIAATGIFGFIAVNFFQNKFYD